MQVNNSYVITSEVIPSKYQMFFKLFQKVLPPSIGQIDTKNLLNRSKNAWTSFKINLI